MYVKYNDILHNPEAIEQKRMFYLSDMNNYLLELVQVLLIPLHIITLAHMLREWLIQLEMNRELMHQYILVQF